MGKSIKFDFRNIYVEILIVGPLFIGICGKCPLLNPINVDLTCYRRGSTVDCEGSLPAGTSVHPRCKKHHVEKFRSYSRVITCQKNGQWDNTLLKCVPECGERFVSDGYGKGNGIYSEAPWNVAIYRKGGSNGPSLICGGTIISAFLVVSAAVCFYDEAANKPLNPNLFEIMVGKVTRNYTVQDNRHTKTYKIREFLFPTKGFHGSISNFAANIVLLRISEEIALFRSVLPACIYWGDQETFNPGKNAQGKFFGWGVAKNGFRQSLRAVNLTYISYDDCLTMAGKQQKSLVPLDNFCARSTSGDGPGQGESGEGLLFPDRLSGAYYLRGIASRSIKDTSGKPITTFTDLTEHLAWLNRIHDTEEQNHMKCPGNQFQCRLGACILMKDKCNGYKNCPDGSDELPSLCTSKVGTAMTAGLCVLPAQARDVDYEVTCPDETKECNSNPGEIVPKFAQISLRCKAEYARYGGNEFYSSCTRGTWVPPIGTCGKICKNLRATTVDLTCTYNGTSVDCNGPLITGTVVRPRCKPLHNEEGYISDPDITCRRSGRWTNHLLKCVPECGKPNVAVTKLISNGQRELFGDSPWHVAIYTLGENNQHTYICGGTIISAELVVSAAHCFYDDIYQKPFKADQYELAVGKYTRTYNKKDNGETKIYKIQQIFFPDVSYTGSSSNYASDIAIVRVVGRISLSANVLLACVYWTDTDHLNLPENTLGKVVGWGENENGTLSATLQKANLPFISHNECIKNEDENFRSVITFDKFCAGSKKGPGARVGDSGGGLLFLDKRTHLYYLRGVVSVKNQIETSITIFTDLNPHMNWIKKVRNMVEEEERQKNKDLTDKSHV